MTDYDETAREWCESETAAFFVQEWDDSTTEAVAIIARLLAKTAEKEREACEKCCEREYNADTEAIDATAFGYNYACEEIRLAIRDRGKQ